MSCTATLWNFRTDKVAMAFSEKLNIAQQIMTAATDCNLDIKFRKNLRGNKHDENITG